jgi:hypothetical protein
MVKSCSPSTRAEFVDLVCGGMSILAATRRVGVTHGAERIWWAQSGHMMGVNMGPSGSCRSCTHGGRSRRPDAEPG